MHHCIAAFHPEVFHCNISIIPTCSPVRLIEFSQYCRPHYCVARVSLLEVCRVRTDRPWSVVLSMEPLGPIEVQMTEDLRECYNSSREWAVV